MTLFVKFSIPDCRFIDINLGVELEPEFQGTIQNVTYPAGREAVLTCTVKNLGKYKVSNWIP